MAWPKYIKKKDRAAAGVAFSWEFSKSMEEVSFMTVPEFQEWSDRITKQHEAMRRFRVGLLVDEKAAMGVEPAAMEG